MSHCHQLCEQNSWLLILSQVTASCWMLSTLIRSPVPPFRNSAVWNVHQQSSVCVPHHNRKFNCSVKFTDDVPCTVFYVLLVWPPQLACKMHSFFPSLAHTSRKSGAPPLTPCSCNLHKMHSAFEFGQLVLFPHSTRQFGRIGIKTLRKIHLFGMCTEPLPQQVYYLIDEAQTIAVKGTKMAWTWLVSLLVRFFSSSRLTII